MHWLSILWRGFAMGAADIIPGISGGTIALITHIYERLIDAEPNRFVRVDATQSPEAVLDRVEDVFDRLVDEDTA